MDLNRAAGAAATATSLPVGIDHAALEADGPKAFGDKMGTPAADEKVLWKGRPTLSLLARSAFHTHKLAFYFAVLIAIALASGRSEAAVVAAVLGTALLAILYLLAWLSARSTLYILTDERLIMRIGMAIETRINIPLKQIKSAHLRPRGKDHGDIAFELNGDRILGTVLLWPHVRPWHYAHPQPMLRAVPEAQALAQLIAETRGQFGAIERNLTEIKEQAPANGHHGVQPVAVAVRTASPIHRDGQGLEGAPA
ncbi:MAG: photosynthetic complex assembly protein [Erythrobacter sp.]|nr:photosynthetic complex assembly protein [Erythrobacter sp.]